MSMKTANSKLTICEVIRKVNDLVQGPSGRDMEARKLLSEAEVMAKKICLKLLEYKREAGGEEWYEWEKNNPTVEEDMKRRIKESYKHG